MGATPDIDFDWDMVAAVSRLGNFDPDNWIIQSSIRGWVVAVEGAPHVSPPPNSGQTDISLIRNLGIPTARLGWPSTPKNVPADLTGGLGGMGVAYVPDLAIACRKIIYAAVDTCSRIACGGEAVTIETTSRAGGSLRMATGSEDEVAGGEIPHIVVQNVSKTYASPRGDVVALNDVSFKIQKGQFISLLGLQRLRQKHAAQNDRRPRDLDGGIVVARREVNPGSPAGPWDGVSEGRAARLAHGDPETSCFPSRCRT